MKMPSGIWVCHDHRRMNADVLDAKLFLQMGYVGESLCPKSTYKKAVVSLYPTHSRAFYSPSAPCTLLFPLPLRRCHLKWKTLKSANTQPSGQTCWARALHTCLSLREK
ncbi:hypothetical protein Nepgr_012188 [Nepenthes gracilis]|uniref:Uncharacterized protein n=1 Tax=Nepenthes gracilis TaxID=150966 RepID=A0AAD3XML5_NEPGR|nr:hypothetical protein Nepgr_012188 [Nepenthes gracilis]